MREAAPYLLDSRIAERLRALRSEHGLSLDDLAQRTTVSRATLSRLENGEVSPTTAVLAKLCSAYNLTLSRLMHNIEGEFEAHLPAALQPLWSDPQAKFDRRSVSPPAHALRGEVLECRLGPGALIDYDGPPRQGLEHHLIVLEGRLVVTIEGRQFEVGQGDCLRYQLFGQSRFETLADTPARYFLFMV